jgi:hypothetical protein
MYEFFYLTLQIKLNNLNRIYMYNKIVQFFSLSVGIIKNYIKN